MRLVPALLAILLCAASVRAADSDLTTDTGLVVPLPREGLTWVKIQEMPARGDVPRMQVYAAAKQEASSHVMVLVVAYMIPTNDNERIAHLKGTHEGLIDGLKAQGFTDIQSTKPSFEAPIPVRVSFTASGKDATGTERHLLCQTYYGKKATYVFQSLAPNAEDAAEMIRKVESAKDE